MNVKQTILILEDEEKLSNSLAHGLQLLGYETAQAYSAHEALSVISNDSPALLLLDLMLPGMSGIEFLKKIRNKG
ncbi:MAG: response regulator, partial [Chitinivibrionales bacterium]|nr:response regulator [Chitinivibrionales bacterium]